MGILNGKTAVITGSSRGLGLGIATALASEGANVVLSARTQSTLDNAVSQLRANGAQAAGIVCDTSNLPQVEALADFTIQQFGRIDIWVNNAGIGAPYGSTLLVHPEHFVKVINTNILGVYYGSITAMKYLVEQHSGKLINLVGRGADGPVPYQNAYASSKIWVRSFTLALAKEYAQSGVGVYAFNPGLVQTDMTGQVDVCPGFEEKVKPLNTVMCLWSNPPEVPAKKVLWLASSTTDGKTGLNVNVMGPGLLLVGALKELVRKISGKPSLLPDAKIKVVE